MADSQERSRDTATETKITLEQARLQIGDIVLLQAQGDTAIERYTARLIGMSKGLSVLVSTPMIDGKWQLMREGKSFILRAFSGKSAYAFSTHILKIVNTPYPYLHLSYPREVRSLVVREAARADVNVICAITACDDVPIQASGTIINLSIGGALMTVKEPPGQKGQQLTIKFKVVVGGNDVLLELGALIRSITADSGDTLYRLGLQFVNDSARNSIPLQAFIDRHLLVQSLGA
jgi:c-di-GMP-binding flagellar brake protein YcgR